MSEMVVYVREDDEAIDLNDVAAYHFGIMLDQTGEIPDITNKARYISIGGRSLHMPYIQSNKGYSLSIASEKTVLFNGIRTYGQYIYTEGSGTIDYFFTMGDVKSGTI